MIAVSLVYTAAIGSSNKKRLITLLRLPLNHLVLRNVVIFIWTIPFPYRLIFLHHFRGVSRPGTCILFIIPIITLDLLLLLLLDHLSVDVDLHELAGLVLHFVNEEGVAPAGYYLALGSTAPQVLCRVKLIKFGEGLILIIVVAALCILPNINVHVNIDAALLLEKLLEVLLLFLLKPLLPRPYRICLAARTCEPILARIVQAADLGRRNRPLLLLEG